MILIFSEINDRSTSNVIDWLIAYGLSFCRINIEDVVIIDKIEISNEKTSIILNINDKTIDLADVNAFWYRRGGISLYNPINTKNTLFSTLFNSYLDDEKNIVEDFIFETLKEKRGIGSFLIKSVNKLNVLNEAAKCGLSVPTTFLSNMDNVAINAKFNNQIVTKAISEAIHIVLDESNYILNYTSGLKEEKIIKDNYRFPYLIQHKIKKIFEIRSFFFNGIFYSMAIFSQDNVKTIEDFRNYDLSNPVRTVPYKLPDEIEHLLLKLMDKLNLDTGSIDLAFDEDHNYVFFEVNPVGQYGMVSGPCNYYIDKIIAEKLIEIAKIS